jgi:hypothetical protein
MASCIALPKSQGMLDQTPSACRQYHPPLPDTTSPPVAICLVTVRPCESVLHVQSPATDLGLISIFTSSTSKKNNNIHSARTFSVYFPHF